MEGIDDAILALSKGATFVEKHFTINKKLQEEIIICNIT